MRYKRIYCKEILADGFYMLCETDQSKPIGFFGLSKTNELHGLFIEPQYRKQGYAKELLECLHNYGIRIQTVTSPKNISMQMLLEKMGYKKWIKYEDST